MIWWEMARSKLVPIARLWQARWLRSSTIRHVDYATLRENGLKLVTDNRHRLRHGRYASIHYTCSHIDDFPSSVGTHWRGSMPTRLPWQPWPCNAYMLAACLLRYKRSRMRSVQSAVSYLYVCGYIDAMFCLQLFELRATPEVLGVMELMLKPG